MKVKEWFRRFIAGLAIGAGAAIPGVSGAAIAVIFKVYEDIIGAVNNFRKKFGWAIKVLIPILLGIAIAVAACIVLFAWAFEHLMFVLICLFAGFLIGSFPGITDEVKGEKVDRQAVILIIIGGVFVISLGVLSVIIGMNATPVESLFKTLPFWLYLVLIPIGAVAAVALTVPGLSGSLILLILGFYRPLVTSVKDWAKELLLTPHSTEHTLALVLVLLCFAVGCLIGVILVSKIMKVLLAKHRKQTFFTIIGFIAGSIFVLFFNYDIFNYYRVWNNVALADELNIHQLVSMPIEMVIGFVTLAVSGFLSYLLVRAQRKKAVQTSQVVEEEVKDRKSVV